MSPGQRRRRSRSVRTSRYAQTTFMMRVSCLSAKKVQKRPRRNRLAVLLGARFDSPRLFSSRHLSPHPPPPVRLTDSPGCCRHPRQLPPFTFNTTARLVSPRRIHGVLRACRELGARCGMGRGGMYDA